MKQFSITRINSIRKISYNPYKLRLHPIYDAKRTVLRMYKLGHLPEKHKFERKSYVPGWSLIGEIPIVYQYCFR